MSIFYELLPSLFQNSERCTKNLKSVLKDALECLDKFEEEFQNQNGRRKTREKTQKDKNALTTTLQSIDEGEDEPAKLANPPEPHTSNTCSDSQSSTGTRQNPKKRSKNEVDGISSPEQDKRHKRNASVKAQSIISKQVNVNLTQKLRRENSTEKPAPVRQSSRSRRQKDEEKENLTPLEILHIKQEKISIVSDPEPMETEAVTLPMDIEIKREKLNDDIAMPPPVAPVPKPRRGVPKEKSQEKPVEISSDEEPSRRSRRGTRNKKTTDVVPPDGGTNSRPRRSGCASSPEPAAPEPRPKRTRRKKLSEIRADSGNATQSSTESLPGASPADKPRPKRTRRAQKADKEEPKPVEPKPTEPQQIFSPKDERPSEEQQPSSPILKEIKPRNKKEKIVDDSTKQLTKSNSSDKDLANTTEIDKDLANTKNVDRDLTNTKTVDKDLASTKNVDKDLPNTEISDSDSLTKSKKDKVAKSKTDKDIASTKQKVNGLLVKSVETLATSGTDQVDTALNETTVLSKATEMNETITLPNGVYNHIPQTPKDIHLNETMVLDKTIVLHKPNGIMDGTIILDRAPAQSNLTQDNSLLTDDDSDAQAIPNTPPRKGIPDTQPLSVVKEKVQQFEEMASRITRTKTRAMAKKEEETGTENQTPPDKVSKVIISNETLAKMNSLIFNGKPPQATSSACKPRPTVPTKLVTSSASKAAAIRAREAEETLKREDARQKKEAMLEAKREQQKRKREEKMAAAAAARSLAERERRAVLEAAAKETMKKQQHAESEKIERLKEAERKRQELARKVAETEERRRAEEAARHQRLAEEQRRALEQRHKKHEELEAMRREEARMAKEIEKKQREYIEKQKKHKMTTPFKTPHTPLGKYGALPPAHMEDGFQYLNSDEEADPPARPVPSWSSTQARLRRLALQKIMRPAVVDEWFRVGVQSPDLSEIFPQIERARLKRTSSAVWHTPPRQLAPN